MAVPHAARLPLERQVGVAAPLVPGAGVVARVVAGAAERERRECRARAGVAVRDDLRALGRADERADLLCRQRQPVLAEERVDLHALRTGEVALPRIARAAAPAGVLLLAPDVEDRQRRIVEARRELLPRRQRARVRDERRLAHGLELDGTVDELAAPAGDAAEQDRDVRVA